MSLDFASLSLSPSLLKVIHELGFTAPTPIQSQSIPNLIAGKDLIGESQTGSGKTLAFALPILQRLDLESRNIQALILCPTRELCAQVAREIKKFARNMTGARTVILSGGQPIRPQLVSLADGPHIAIGTPGRVLDHLSRNSLDLSQTRCVVLDEADRMLDMGFKDDMEEILRHTPKSRQTVFFSATFPAEIKTLSESFQKTPLHVVIEEEQQALPDIRHQFCELEFEDKPEALLDWLLQNQPKAALVFCRLKATAVELADWLSSYNIDVDALHGDIEQRDRDRVLAKLRNGSLRVLIATDVVARGIDVEHLDVVVNFDLPPTPDVYVHRVGRTGRAGASGLALSLMTRHENHKVESIEQLTGIPVERIERPARSAERKTASLFANMETLYISGGRKEKMRPGDILGALTGVDVGLLGADIGKIEIHDHLSYVAVTKGVAKTALKKLQNGQIKGRRFIVSVAR